MERNINQLCERHSLRIRCVRRGWQLRLLLLAPWAAVGRDDLLELGGDGVAALLQALLHKPELLLRGVAGFRQADRERRVPLQRVRGLDDRQPLAVVLEDLGPGRGHGDAEELQEVAAWHGLVEGQELGVLGGLLLAGFGY